MAYLCSRAFVALIPLTLLVAALPRGVVSAIPVSGGWGSSSNFASRSHNDEPTQGDRRSSSDGHDSRSRGDVFSGSVVPLIFSSHGNLSMPFEAAPERSHENLRAPDSRSQGLDAQPAYFERAYSGGWWSSGPIFNSRVESTDLPAVISSRGLSFLPAFVSAYAVSTPRSLVFFSILWQPNANKLPWVLVFNLNGRQYQDALHHYISSGYKPSQVESYYVADQHGLYYSAIFLADVAWPAGSSTRVEAVFGVPHDSTYCCGPSSRWLLLQRQGFTPLSVTLTEDPSSKQVYVADIWNDAPSRGGWQGGMAKTEPQLQQALSSILPPLVPIFLKAYWVSSRRQVFYAYLARPPPGAPPHYVLTTDVSRSAFELLAQTLKKPPLFVTTCGPADGAAQEGGAPGSGERYTVLWEPDTVNGTSEKKREGEQVGVGNM